MGFTPDVEAILQALREGVEATLAEELVGLCLRGSLVLGDFDPTSSDVDFLAITEQPVDGPLFERLAAMHEHLARLNLRYSHHLEGAYIDRASVRRFGRQERRHPELLAGKALTWSQLRDNWVLERWTVRERGRALVGADPKDLIAPISGRELRAAVLSELVRRVEDWAGESTQRPRWLQARFMQAFEVETICRALYTLGNSELPSKPRAVAWARETLPARWRALVDETQTVPADESDDDRLVEEVCAFARWAASDGRAWARMRLR